MKKLFGSIILTLAIVSYAFSQVEIGFSLGSNISKVQVRGVADGFAPDNQYIRTFRPALTVNIPLDEHFSIYTGIASENRGFDVFVGQNVNFLGLNIPLGATAKTRISYIEIPLNFRLDFDTERNVRPWVAAGANVGYAYDGYIQTQINLILNINVSKSPINLDSDNVGRWDIAPNITAGLDFPYKRGFFTVSLGYEHSAQNFIKDSVIGIETRHFGFTPAVGYSIALGKVSKA